MDETPKYTDLDAEPSRKYTNLDSFQGPAAAPSAAPSLAPTNPAGYPSMDPNSPQAGSAYNGYYQQSPGGSNGYYNGMMPGQPQPRFGTGVFMELFLAVFYCNDHSHRICISMKSFFIPIVCDFGFDNLSIKYKLVSC